jgi:hypothetical protein
MLTKVLFFMGGIQKASGRELVTDFRPEAITFSENIPAELINITKLARYAALIYPVNFE